MKFGVLFSGGKDSTFALMKALEKDDVACLISLISENSESYMFHTPNIGITALQAEALGIPLISVKTKGMKEEELADLEHAIMQAKEKYHIEGIVTGAVASVYQSERIKKICDRLGLKCISPLWKKNQEELLNEIVDSKIKAIISGVFAPPLDEKWLGKQIDKKMIVELSKLRKQYKISPSGEGGEIETTVLDAPVFHKMIEIIDYDIKTDKNSGVLIINKAKLIEKS
jgi:ABC transporter with metal-binding/Fe-S-binding domain ATP-binding protein